MVTSLGASFFPYPASASFMSTLVKLISTVNTATDSMAGLIGAFPPLLGAQASGSAGNMSESTSSPAQTQDQQEYADSLVVSQDSALVGSRNPAGTLLDTEHDAITVYTVRPGDSPGLIARRFGISLNTILWANDIKNPNLIKSGDQLIILPVSGIQYDVKKGDTLEFIAQRFKPRNGNADVQALVSDIVSFNGLSMNETLAVGTTIIIPDGELISAPKSNLNPTPVPRSSKSKTPQQKTVQFTENDDAYYIRPVIGGVRTRGIHGMNGVDLANSCGVPVYASAEGTVILARDSGWNGGYGEYIIVTHPNGTQTLYAHLSAIYVQVGQKVTKAMQIGDVGTTGNSTGCHLHFEIRGARNPF